MQKSTHFFRNLPPKTCVVCQNKIPEMSESYVNECGSCFRKRVN
ncbi:MAG TPA: protein YhfH [Bacillales bacterium]|nr:protein YhfH [Bacillales bacterium]